MANVMLEILDDFSFSLGDCGPPQKKSRGISTIKATRLSRYLK